MWSNVMALHSLGLKPTSQTYQSFSDNLRDSHLTTVATLDGDLNPTHSVGSCEITLATSQERYRMYKIQVVESSSDEMYLITAEELAVGRYEPWPPHEICARPE